MTGVHLNYMWKDEVDKTTGVVVQQGIASELGIVGTNMTAEEKEQRSKEIFAWINIFFMVAYGIKPAAVGRYV